MKTSHNLIFKYIRDEYYPPVSLTLEWFFDGSFAIHCGSIRELSCVFHWQGIYSTVVLLVYILSYTHAQKGSHRISTAAIAAAD